MRRDKPALSEKVCEGCRKHFLPRAGGQIYCSTKCKEKARTKRKKKVSEIEMFHEFLEERELEKIEV